MLGHRHKLPCLVSERFVFVFCFVFIIAYCLSTKVKIHFGNFREFQKVYWEQSVTKSFPKLHVTLLLKYHWHQAAGTSHISKVISDTRGIQEVSAVHTIPFNHCHISVPVPRQSPWLQELPTCAVEAGRTKWGHWVSLGGLRKEEDCHSCPSRDYTIHFSTRPFTRNP